MPWLLSRQRTNGGFTRSSLLFRSPNPKAIMPSPVLSEGVLFTLSGEAGSDRLCIINLDLAPTT